MLIMFNCTVVLRFKASLFKPINSCFCTSNLNAVLLSASRKKKQLFPSNTTLVVRLERFAVPLAGLYPSVVPLPRYPRFGRRSGFAFQQHVFSKGGHHPHGIVDEDRGGRCGRGAHVHNICVSHYFKEKRVNIWITLALLHQVFTSVFAKLILEPIFVDHLSSKGENKYFAHLNTSLNSHFCIQPWADSVRQQSNNIQPLKQKFQNEQLHFWIFINK